MYNFLAKQYNQRNVNTCSLVNEFISEELLSIAVPIEVIPENADELYLKINNKFYDPIEICTALEVINLRNEIANIKNIELK